MNESKRPQLRRIAEAVRRLVLRCGTRDPYRIARLLGIYVLYPEGLLHLKGFYRVIEGKRFIFLNGAGSEQEKRIVCAHELGHDALHREYAEKKAFQELELFGHASRHEYEANLFLAELLIEDEEMLETAEVFLQSSLNVSETSRNLYMHRNTLLYRLDKIEKSTGLNIRLFSDAVSFRVLTVLHKLLKK